MYRLAEASDGHLIALGNYCEPAAQGEANTYYDTCLTRFSKDYSAIKRLQITNPDTINGLGLTAAGNDRLFAAAYTTAGQTPVFLLDNELNLVRSTALDGLTRVSTACYSEGILYLMGTIDNCAVLVSLSKDLAVLNAIRLPGIRNYHNGLCPLAGGGVLVGSECVNSNTATLAVLQPDLTCSRAVSFVSPSLEVILQRNDGAIFIGGRHQWSRLSADLAIETTVQGAFTYNHGAINGDRLVLSAYVKPDNATVLTQLIETDHDFNTLQAHRVTTASAEQLPVNMSQSIRLSNGDVIRSAQQNLKLLVVANTEVVLSSTPLQLEAVTESPFEFQRVERVAEPATLLSEPVVIPTNAYTPQLRYS